MMIETWLMSEYTIKLERLMSKLSFVIICTRISQSLKIILPNCNETFFFTAFMSITCGNRITFEKPTLY